MARYKDDSDYNRPYIDPNEQLEMDILEARERYNHLKFYGTGLVIVFTILTLFIWKSIIQTLFILLGCSLIVGVMLLGAYSRVRGCEKRYRNKLSIKEEFRGR